MSPWVTNAWFGGVLLLGALVQYRMSTTARKTSQVARLVRSPRSEQPHVHVGSEGRGGGGRGASLGLKWISQLGTLVIRIIPWTTTASPTSIGMTTVLALIASAFNPILGLVVVATSAARARRIRRVGEQQRVAAIRSELSLLLDLLRVAVSAGLTMRQAILITCGPANADAPGSGGHDRSLHQVGELSALLLNAVTGVGRGERYVDAVAAMVDVPVIGPELALLASTLIGTERFGTPSGPALASLAADVRDLRRRLAEAEARKVPVRMLAPLVLLLLPSFALLTLAPLLAGGLSSLRLTT
jgi:hypothetical protein